LAATSKVPPIPTPTIIGGHGFGPAFEITSLTKAFIPSFPCAGAKTVARLTFSLPPPFAAYSISILSPGTISKWITAGRLYPTSSFKLCLSKQSQVLALRYPSL
jgi:hypothetical protein